MQSQTSHCALSHIQIGVVTQFDVYTWEFLAIKNLQETSQTAEPQVTILVYIAAAGE